MDTRPPGTLTSPRPVPTVTAADAPPGRPPPARETSLRRGPPLPPRPGRPFGALSQRGAGEPREGPGPLADPRTYLHIFFSSFILSGSSRGSPDVVRSSINSESL